MREILEHQANRYSKADSWRHIANAHPLHSSLYSPRDLNSMRNSMASFRQKGHSRLHCQGHEKDTEKLVVLTRQKPTVALALFGPTFFSYDISRPISSYPTEASGNLASEGMK